MPIKLFLPLSFILLMSFCLVCAVIIGFYFDREEKKKKAMEDAVGEIYAKHQELLRAEGWDPICCSVCMVTWDLNKSEHCPTCEREKDDR